MLSSSETSPKINSETSTLSYILPFSSSPPFPLPQLAPFHRLIEQLDHQLAVTTGWLSHFPADRVVEKRFHNVISGCFRTCTSLFKTRARERDKLFLPSGVVFAGSPCSEELRPKGSKWNSMYPNCVHEVCGVCCCLHRVPLFYARVGTPERVVDGTHLHLMKTIHY